MIKAAFILPHSPVLIPSIGRENQAILQQTLNSYDKVRAKLQEEKIDTILIITPHGPIGEDFFNININTEYGVDFSKFGDLGTKTKIKSDFSLAHRLKNSLSDKKILKLTSQDNLDYGSAIPAQVLTTGLPNIKVIPLSYSQLSLVEHQKFGQALQQELQNSRKKIAIIASGDLSHRLKKNSPAGYSPKGAKFDNRVIELLNKGPEGLDGLLNIDPKLIQASQECGLRSIVLLSGILKNLPQKGKLMSYQKDLGIGYLCFEFSLSEPKS